jgi:CBS domain-containing protein
VGGGRSCAGPGHTNGERSDRPKGIITDTDIAQAIADGKDLNKVRIIELMTQSPDRHQRGDKHP